MHERRVAAIVPSVDVNRSFNEKLQHLCVPTKSSEHKGSNTSVVQLPTG